MKTTLFFIFSIISLSVSAQTSSARTERDAEILADSVYEKLMDGADFGALVARYSEDPGSKNKGGKYFEVAEGAFAPEFEEQVLKLQLLEISKPFRSPFGYHVAQLLTRSENRYTVRHILIKCGD